METLIEKQCGALEGLFQAVINDMKGSYPVWEDFVNKATKLNSQLRTTTVAVVAFLDAFQKVADMATNTRGSTREIGSALTRVCIRHRSIESKLRQVSTALMESLVSPLQEKIEDWKRSANQLDKDHAKEYKRVRQEIKKKSSDTLKLQKKVRKDAQGKGVDVQPQLELALQDVNDSYLLLEETEKGAVRRALIEERGRFCTFVYHLRPVLDQEISMLEEVTHLQTIVQDLTNMTSDPHRLPPASEQVILDLKGSDFSWKIHTPPASPSLTASSRRSSVSSVAPPTHLSSRFYSVSSRDSGFPAADAASLTPPDTQTKVPSPASSDTSEACLSTSDCSSPSSTSTGSTQGAALKADKSLCGCDRGREFEPAVPPPPAEPAPSIMPMLHHPRSLAHRPASLAFPPYHHQHAARSPRASYHQRIACKEWSKQPSPYEQPSSSATLPRTIAETETDSRCAVMTGPPTVPQPGRQGPDTPRPQSVAFLHGGKVDVLVPGELSKALVQGLQLESQKSSRDSLQCSSGYSTQTTTPTCSEDTISSQASDQDYFSVNGDADEADACGQQHLLPPPPQHLHHHQQQQQQQTDADKCCTVPRGSELAQSYRRMLQVKRPVSTAGLPCASGMGPSPSSPPSPHGVATIRRVPSAKTAPRPTGGPRPIRPPSVPVRRTALRVDVSSPGVLVLADESSPHRMAPPELVSPEERLHIAATRRSMTERLGAVVVAAHAHAQSHSPFSPFANTNANATGAGAISATTSTAGSGAVTVTVGAHEDARKQTTPHYPVQAQDMLTAIRRGVRLRKTSTNDRSAPRF
uniref:Protein MTSS 2-like isoform X2 n=1 Tax=Petromyzon marinus TaxID=7757 RepID=A0AAJ7XAD4_PETMA|nr:protein MTSS 2-like isoform X2 [Petromyzon marinus]